MTEDYTFAIQAPKPSYMLCFHKNNQQVGFFDFNEGKMHFEGDLTESGKVFVDWILNSFQERIDAAVAEEREACAKVCESINADYDSAIVESCAAEIRARGNT